MSKRKTLPVYKDFIRDQWGRPKVIPQGGGAPFPYKRCTSYVGVLEDRYNLEMWMKRMTMLGVAERDDLRLSALAHKDDKAHLNKLVEQALEAAKASSAATVGTAIHSLTDIVDRGEPLPDGLPRDAIESLDAYRAATAELKVIHIEHPVVIDTLQVAGTPDRIVEYKGERYIADTKTGNIELGIKKIAMQLAIYARSWFYDVETGERSPSGVSTNRAIVYHVPAGAGTAELRWIDIEAGWEAVRVARDIWRERLCEECRGRGVSRCSHQFGILTDSFGPPPQPSLRLQKRDAEEAVRRAETEYERILKLVQNSPTYEVLSEVWRTNQTAWSDKLTAAAKVRAAELQTAAAS